MYKWILAALLVATPVVADETWTNGFGDVIYEEDFETTALFSAASPDGTIWMYIDNLAGNYSMRDGIFTGVWLIEEDGFCGSSLIGEDGRGSNFWGTLELVWDNSGFPSGWSARLGDCGQIPFRTMRATPPQ
ncbi:hypothetical protein [Algirhabdus cladophorae]|uniref:hypothetical protein n=1 Tax=Algirhabdus cladophorae TaxID=3377108 RepID=UPI003B848166